MLSLVQKQTMSVQDFLQNSRLKEIEVLESNSIYINKSKRLKKMFAFVIGSIMYCKKVYASSGAKGVDPLGFKLLGIFRSFAYWICIIMCIVEICKSLLQGDTRSIGKIVIKYILAFASIYFVPWIFDLIRESF